jgi:mannose-6-phosphate isomerase-like protein (cupin superfamily)
LGAPGATMAAPKPMKLPILVSLLALGLSRACIAAEPPPAPPTDVVFYDHVQVDAAFAKGFPICINSSYKVLAGHRVVPGKVEMHVHDTDIFYIVDGTATFVTGGTCADLKEGKTGEFGGTMITGGTEHHLGKGDVITIPAGILHQYTVVNGPFLYFVVKVTR